MEEITINYTQRDLWKASCLHSKRFVQEFLAAALVMITPSAVYGSFYADWIPLFFLVIMIPVSLSMRYLHRYYVTFRLSRMALFRAGVSIQFNQISYHARSQSGVSEVTRLHGIKWSSEMLLFCHSPYTFFAIPRRFCNDDMQFWRLLSLGQALSSESNLSLPSTTPSDQTERNA